MAGVVFTRASDVATELGVTMARVKAIVKRERLPYGTDRKGDYLLQPNAIELIAKAIIREPKTSRKQVAAARVRGQKRKEAAKTAV